MNQFAAISFLRNLIHTPEREFRPDRVDFGWCCSEHAFVACLAFAIAGKRMLFCNGQLVILRRESREGLDVKPHYFLVDDSRRVFDSSITFENCLGISTEPPSGILVVAGKDHPGIPALHSKLTRSPADRIFCYTATSPKALGPEALKWVSSTPFGDWLTDRFGNQDGLWAKAAWFVAQELNGTPSGLGDGRAAMWDSIAGSTNHDEAVALALQNLIPMR